MKKREYVVRVLWISYDSLKDSSGLLIEQLRYCGHIVIHKDHIPLVIADDGPIKSNPTLYRYREMGRDEQGNTDGWMMVFDIHPPARVGDSQAWSSQNASRMQSFGINAQSVPRYSRDSIGE